MEGRIDDGFEYLTGLLIEYKEDQEKSMKLEQLYNYLYRNREGLKPYLLRDIKLPELEEGLEYRNLGTMEHNICDIIALRMKGRKMSWSVKGANYLAKLLAARASGTLYKRLDELFNDTIPEDKLEEITEIIQLSSAEVNRKVGVSKVYKIRRSPIPFEGQPLTEEMKAIRKLVENRIASDLVYR